MCIIGSLLVATLLALPAPAAALPGPNPLCLAWPPACVGGEVIRDVLAAYPRRRVVRTFDVAETPSGHDRAALIDKMVTPQPPR